MFREIGLADELGSGMRNTYKFTKLYSGGEPQFTEGDVFRTVIPLNEIATMKSGPKDEKSVFESEKWSIEGGNPPIQEGNSPIRDEKLFFEDIEIAMQKQNYKNRTKEYILRIYSNVETNQEFGAPEVEQILECSNTTAKEFMRRLRSMHVITDVKGKGKGKYRFVNKDEL